MKFPDFRRATPRRREDAAMQRLLFAVALMIGGLSCRADRVLDVEAIDGSDALTLDAPVVLTTPTYDGSGQAVHPDFAAAPAWWMNQNSYLALTPYPGGDITKENPSLLMSTGTRRWRNIDGAPNPLVLPGDGYLSDPDILFDADSRQLWLYYRFVGGGKNVIKLIRSSDSQHWSEPEVVLSEYNHEVVSPSVVRRGPHDWWMWAVNSGPAGCGALATHVDLRHSKDGRTWDAPVKVDFPSPVAGYTPWHIDVQWIPSRWEYWAVYNAKIASNCATTAVFLSTSPDGTTWTARPVPLLVAGELPSLALIVYRATFAYDAASDAVTFWYSGASAAKDATDKLVWRTVSQRRRRTHVFDRTGGTLGANNLEIPKPVRLIHPP